MRTEESWGAATATWNVCVWFFFFCLHLGGFFFITLTHSLPKYLQCCSCCQTAAVTRQCKQSSLKYGHRWTASLSLWKNELIMRPQQEKKQFSIFGNRNNKTNKDDYRIKERNPLALIAQVSFSLHALLCQKKKIFLKSIRSLCTSIQLNKSPSSSRLLNLSQNFPDFIWHFNDFYSRVSSQIMHR